MYKIHLSNRKLEKLLQKYISLREGIKGKLDNLKLEPRRANGLVGWVQIFELYTSLMIYNFR